MADALICDACGRSGRRTGMISWLEVGLPPGSVDVRILSDPEWPLHFCSSECIATWSYDRWRAGLPPIPPQPDPGPPYDQARDS